MEIDNRITSESGDTIDENLKNLGRIRNFDFWGKDKIKVGNEIGDSGCIGIFNNAKYLTNLEVLYIGGKSKDENRMWNNRRIK